MHFKNYILTTLLILSMVFGLLAPALPACAVEDGQDAAATEEISDESADETQDEDSDEASGESEAEEDSDTSEAASTENASQDDASTAPQVIEESGNACSAGNPIGDAAAYYGIDGENGLSDGPDIEAESAILMDYQTGAILYKKEAETKRYPASITKVMTALLAIENCDLSDIVTYSDSAVNGIEEGSSTAGINVGAQLTVEDSLYALMLVSANEAAAALAEHISGSTEAFAELMTSRAEELGCTGTHFANPHGLPDEDHYTTAHDMGLILQQAMKYDAFRKISSTITYTLKESDTLTDTLELWNHAKILRENSDYYYEYAEGAKTGYTQAALNTLVTYAEKDGVQLLCVILKDYGADNSYYDTASLFKWGFEQVKSVTPLSGYDINTALSENEDIAEDDLASLQGLNPTFNADYYLLTNADFDESALTETFSLEEDKNTGLLGYINIYSGDTVIGKTPVTYDITSDAGNMYLNGGSGGSADGLETAPVDEDILTPHKILNFLIRFVIAVFLIIVIMGFIRRRQLRKEQAKRDAGRRRRQKH